MRNEAKAYWRYRYTLALIGLFTLAAYLTLIQLTGWSLKLRDFSVALSGNYYVTCLIYLSMLMLGFYAISLPVNFYEGYVLEHKFSLSNQTLTGWMKDEFKKSAISIVIFLCLVLMFYWIARNVMVWWLACSCAWVFFSIIFTRLFPTLIIPMFYKCKAVSDKTLRDRTMALAAGFNIKLMDVYEIDFSKTTKKSNAALVGWGDTRRVILADNLINEFAPDEISVVVAHELAHYKLKHIWKLLLAGSVSTVLFFFILSRTAAALSARLGGAGPLDIAIFPALWLGFVVYGIITMPIINGYSRYLEGEADSLALKAAGSSGAFISLMKKLADKNLADEKPNALIEFILYDHPSIARRIGMARDFERKKVMLT